MTDNRYLIKKSFQAERLLKQYDAIVDSNFSELGDFSRAKRILDRLAMVLEQLGDKNLADHVRAEKDSIDKMLEQVAISLNL